MNPVTLLIFGACLLASAAAIWSMYTSSEERTNRGGFLYSYAAFFAYLLITLIFIILLISIPRQSLEEGAVKMGLQTALGPLFGPLASVIGYGAGRAVASNKGQRIVENIITTTPKFRKNSLLG